MTTGSLICFLTRTINGSQPQREKALLIGIALTFMVLVTMYFCFGSTVMMRHTGYFKAANIFLFVIPFVAGLRQKSLPILLLVFLGFVTLFFNYFLWERITAEPYRPTQQVHYATSEPACLKNYHAKMIPISIEEIASTNFFTHLLTNRSAIINVKITNLSTEPFSPFLGKGAVNISYQWVKENDSSVIKDGSRTQLTETLMPNQSTIRPVYVNFPRTSGKYRLNISLVQEGCAWFYLVNPESSVIIPYQIH